MTVDEKRKLELKTMYQIIGIYCRDKHHTPKGELCEECQDVWHYAQHRIDACPHMESKTFCSVCKTHCYGVRPLLAEFKFSFSFKEYH
mgnify:CR=1 FL=1